MSWLANIAGSDNAAAFNNLLKQAVSTVENKIDKVLEIQPTDASNTARGSQSPEQKPQSSSSSSASSSLGPNAALPSSSTPAASPSRPSTFGFRQISSSISAGLQTAATTISTNVPRGVAKTGAAADAWAPALAATDDFFSTMLSGFTGTAPSPSGQKPNTPTDRNTPAKSMVLEKQPQQQQQPLVFMEFLTDTISPPPIPAPAVITPNERKITTPVFPSVDLSEQKIQKATATIVTEISEQRGQKQKEIPAEAKGWESEFDDIMDLKVDDGSGGQYEGKGTDEGTDEVGKDENVVPTGGDTSVGNPSETTSASEKQELSEKPNVDLRREASLDAPMGVDVQNMDRSDVDFGSPDPHNAAIGLQEPIPRRTTSDDSGSETAQQQLGSSDPSDPTSAIEDMLQPAEENLNRRVEVDEQKEASHAESSLAASSSSNSENAGQPLLSDDEVTKGDDVGMTEESESAVLDTVVGKEQEKDSVVDKSPEGISEGSIEQPQRSRSSSNKPSKTTSDQNDDGHREAALVEVQRQLQEQKNVIQQRETQLVKAMTENATLTDTVVSLKGQMERLEATRSEENARFAGIVKDLRDKLAASEGKLTGLVKERDALKQQSTTLQTSLESANRLISDKEEQVKGLMQEGEKLSKLELKSSTIIKKLRAKESEMDKELKDLQKKYDASASDVTDLREKLLKLQGNEYQLTESVKVITDLNEQQSKRIRSLENDLAASKESEAKLQSALEKAWLELGEARKSQAEAANAAHAEALSKEVQANEELHKSLATLKHEFETAETAYKKEIMELRTALTHAEDAAGWTEDNLRNEISALQARLQAAEERNQDLSSMSQENTGPLLRQIEELQTHHATALKSWENIEQSLTIRLHAAEEERTVFMRKDEESNTKISEMTSKIVALEEMIASERQQHSRLVANLEIERLRSENLERTLNDVQGKAEELQSKHARDLENLKAQYQDMFRQQLPSGERDHALNLDSGAPSPREYDRSRTSHMMKRSSSTDVTSRSLVYEDRPPSSG
ncbi:hypothetical protein HK102_001191, partial [Quaeritorhiza haematococci]